MKRTPWLLLRLAAVFGGTARELVELRPLWRTSVRVDNARLAAELGAEPHTPLDEAVTATLAGVGCIDPRPEPERREP